MGTLSHIMLMYLIWMIVSLLVGYSHEQGSAVDLLATTFASPQAAPLVSQRQSSIPSQQVIVPGGFQHQLYTNQYSNLGGLDSRNARLVQTPISIQNQQFSFLTRDPYARSLSGRTPTSAAAVLPSAKPTASRSLSPNFVEIISPTPERLVSSLTSSRGGGSSADGSGGGSSGQIRGAASGAAPQISGNARNSDVHYEYYDDTDGDVLYQYGNDFPDPSGPSPALTKARNSGQYFTEISPSKPVTPERNVKSSILSRGNPSSAAGGSKREQQTRYSAPSSSLSAATPSGSSQVSNKSAPGPNGNTRLFRPNRPFPSSGSSSSTSSQASRETSSSFIPLIDESEEPEQGLALNGRSVQPNSHRGNSLSVRPPVSLLRSTTSAAPPSAPEVNSSQQSASAPEKPAVPTRIRGQYNRSRGSGEKSTERNASSSSIISNRKPALLRASSSSSGNSSGNRLSVTSRPPIIIRPRNLTRSRQNKTREEPVTASSTYRPDPNFDQAESGSIENPKAPSNALPSAEDYTVEYVEYPFNNEDNSSVVEYYEVSEETAQALLRRAKAKASHRKPSDPSPSPASSSNESSATKVTVSVSSRTSSTTTSTTSSTTPAPLGVESSSSEENVSGQIDPSGEVVISVATTKSVSGVKGGKAGEVTEVPVTITTPTPRVTFSRATGSSFAVASVQTSRSVSSKGQENRASKVIQTEGLKDNMPSGAETAPEYYEEEYTYPDNYPVLNGEQQQGTLQRPTEELEHTEELTPPEHYNPNEYSHESSARPPAITPTKSVVLQSDSNFANGVVKESSESSTAVRNSDESYEDESGSHAPQPRKLPSKKGDIPLSHFETLVDDVSELEVDHPLRPVKQDDLAPPPPPPDGDDDDEASYHVAIQPSTAIPALVTTPTTTTTTTTLPPPTPSSTTEKPNKDPTSIFSSIKFAEISPDFLPAGFKLPSPPELPSSSEASSSSSSTTTTTTTEVPKVGGIQFKEIDVSSLLPKGYKPRPALPKLFTTTSAPLLSTTTTEKPKSLDPLEAIKSIVQFKEIAIPGLIPKDYTTPSPSESPENISAPILPGIKFEIPANLLPPGYKPPADSSEPVIPVKFETPLNLLPKGYSPPPPPPPSSNESNEPAVKFDFPANLLPPGYKPPGSAVPSPPGSAPKSVEAVVSTTKKPGGVVFPTKPGGGRVTRPTTTEPPKGDTPVPPAVRIATGWPTRKTTEFTGWPTSSTTPLPPTSSTTTTTTTEAPTTTTPTTTTTTPPPKRSPPGTCPQGFCKMEATIRIVGGVKWAPEFRDINTDEFKNLQATVKRELDGAYRASGLAPWYKNVEIEAFNRGSVIVDYFLLLDGIDRELSSDYVVRQFHKSLLDSADELPYYDEPEAPGQLVSNGRLRFGRYTIDPRYTDFKVVNVTKDTGSLAQEPLIPQWGIAVIVIGLASLLFVIIFGVTVLVNRHKNSKKKNAVSLTQEMLSEFNKSHMGSGAGGLDNYGADDLYNMDDVWNDKQMDKTFDRKPTKRSQGSAKGSANYNIYDSWKTEWNGYYYNGNYYGDSGYAPSRRRSDYDTNF